jgi:hypothetical protein
MGFLHIATHAVFRQDNARTIPTLSTGRLSCSLEIPSTKFDTNVFSGLLLATLGLEGKSGQCT